MFLGLNGNPRYKFKDLFISLAGIDFIGLLGIVFDDDDDGMMSCRLSFESVAKEEVDDDDEMAERISSLVGIYKSPNELQ